MRYLPLTDGDRRSMLDTIGAASIDDLFSDIPPAARLTAPLDLPPHQGELAVQRAFEVMAAKNLGPTRAPSFLGAGIYRHHVPATVDYLIQRGEFLTAYTPYQPEVSQGTLQAMFEFQTQVALIADMDVANASMYDGATACSEAVMMAARVTRRAKAVLSGGLHPHYREVTETMAALLGVEIDALAADWRGPGGPGAEDLIGRIDDETACVVVQNPGFFGHLNDYTAVAEACHDKGALLVFVVTECMSLGALTPPGAMGADIVAAEGQALGNATSFGGPTVGLMAARQKHVRQMPGRLVGETVDADGRRGFVLTLSTREQHIRREKATSNICTNSGLCALAFTIHLTLLGEDGLRQLAAINHAAAITAADRLASVPSVEVINQTFFNEFTVRLPVPAAPVVDALAERGILAGVPASRLYPDDDDVSPLLLVAVTETNGDDDVDALATTLEEVL